MDTVQELSDPSNTLTFQGHLLKEVHSEKQHWKILKHDIQGPMLFIDNQHQSSLSDEQRQHETFVHSLMFGVAEPRSVLILGGAEGCLAREVIRWPTVERVVQVDWDETLIEQFRGEGSQWNRGAQNDPRVHVICEEALHWLQNTSEKFDCIFIDLLDPTDTNLQFLKQLLVSAKEHLNPCGNLSINAGLVKSSPTAACELADFMKQLFREPEQQRSAVKVHVPSQQGEWCFLMATHRLWSANLLDTMMPKNLRQFSYETFWKSIRWADEYPESLRWQWLRSQEEKNDGTQKLNRRKTSIEIKVFEHHGC